MKVLIEFFGMPRRYAGRARVEVSARDLGAAMAAAAEAVPGFAERCLVSETLRPGYLLSINGRHFVSDPRTPLDEGDCVQVFSADVGG